MMAAMINPSNKCKLWMNRHSQFYLLVPENVSKTSQALESEYNFKN